MTPKYSIHLINTDSNTFFNMTHPISINLVEKSLWKQCEEENKSVKKCHDFSM